MKGERVRQTDSMARTFPLAQARKVKRREEAAWHTHAQTHLAIVTHPVCNIYTPTHTHTWDLMWLSVKQAELLGLYLEHFIAKALTAAFICQTKYFYWLFRSSSARHGQRGRRAARYQSLARNVYVCVCVCVDIIAPYEQTESTRNA